MTARATIAKRRKLMAKSVPFLKKCARDARDGVCIVCGEPNRFCLDNHHIHTKAIDPISIVLLCASCHRVYDKGGSLEVLRERRDRLLHVNRAYPLSRKVPM
jgi:hypothetical protein